MKLIDDNKVYWDNDEEKWYFNKSEDFEYAQRVNDNYLEENRVLKKAYLSACKKLSEVFGECPYSNMNLSMPDYCDEECINNEKYLCWDKYFIERAKKEK